MLEMLKSKIHKAVVTQTELDYEGSITIDESLMDAVGFLVHERVHVWNLTNGSRLSTYVIPGKPDSGVICLNGAAAHLNRVGDRVIIASFVQMTPEEAKTFNPTVIITDKTNKIKRVIK